MKDTICQKSWATGYFLYFDPPPHYGLGVSLFSIINMTVKLVTVLPVLYLTLAGQKSLAIKVIESLPTSQDGQAELDVSLKVRKPNIALYFCFTSQYCLQTQKWLLVEYFIPIVQLFVSCGDLESWSSIMLKIFTLGSPVQHLPEIQDSPLQPGNDMRDHFFCILWKFRIQIRTPICRPQCTPASCPWPAWSPSCSGRPWSATGQVLKISYWQKYFVR